MFIVLAEEIEWVGKTRGGKSFKHTIFRFTGGSFFYNILGENIEAFSSTKDWTQSVIARSDIDIRSCISFLLSRN